MPFKEMRFKGQRVFVEVDKAGKPLTENGRARIKYDLDQDRTYQPWAANLSEIEESEIEEGSAVVAYTDGACIGNPGPTGLGYVILSLDGERIERGEPLGEGTNNIAELSAILRVLETIGSASRNAVIYTDSEYAIGVLCRKWKAKANLDLIEKVKSAMSKFESVDLRKVQAHAGMEENELADKLAREAATTQKATDGK